MLFKLSHILGSSLNILTGRSSNFQVTSVNSGEIQEINLPSNSERTYKFCLVRRETEVAGQKKEYQGDVYSLDVGQADQERRVEIKRTPAGLQVARIRGEDEDVEVLSPVVEGKIYSERERVTAENWSAWLESRHQFKREGPIFLSFTRTRGRATLMELREELEGLVRGNIIRSSSVQFISIYLLKNNSALTPRS